MSDFQAPQAFHHRPTAALNSDKVLSELLPTDFDKALVTLLVEKSQYRLTVFYAQRAIKSYPVVFGSEPVQDKRYEGDGATPEGIFSIRNLYPHARWSKFLWVDYPTEYSWQKHHASKAAGEIPAEAAIGSEIGIHGVPDDKNSLIETRSNWTRGCVALKNPDIDELYEVSSKGMLVEIVR